MDKPLVKLNEFIGVAVMALMIVAVVAGQAGAPEPTINSDVRTRHATQASEFVLVGLNGEFRDSVKKVSMELAADLKHFRGEDE
jgi:hypothetical protein